MDHNLLFFHILAKWFTMKGSFFTWINILVLTIRLLKLGFWYTENLKDNHVDYFIKFCGTFSIWFYNTKTITCINLYIYMIWINFTLKTMSFERKADSWLSWSIILMSWLPVLVYYYICQQFMCSFWICFSWSNL